MLFWFRASLDSELYLIGDMSGRKERTEGNGVGIRSAKADKVDEVVVEEEEEDQEEDEWKPGDEGRRVVYNKNKLFLVEEWINIEKQEALRRVAVIMIEDFHIAGGPIFEYGAQTDKKIGPYGSRNVSVGFIYLFIYPYI